MSIDFISISRSLSIGSLVFGLALGTTSETFAQTSWVGSEGDYTIDANWSDNAVPSAAEAVVIESGTATLASGNFKRDADTTLSGTGKLTIGDGRLLNAAGGPATIAISDEAALTHAGQYFLVANQNAGSIQQTGGVLKSTVSSGWFLSDGGSSVGTYSLSGGELNVFSSAGNGIHFGKNSSGDVFEVDGGTARFMATTGNMRSYFSKGSRFEVDSGSVTFDGFKYLVVGRDYEADTTSQIILNGGSLSVRNVEAGGGFVIANKNAAKVSVNGGAFTLEGDLWIGDADGGFNPKAHGAFEQTGGVVSVHGSIVLSRASSSRGVYTMSEGTLEADAIVVGSGVEPLFDFQGGQILLSGDQTAIFAEDWFQEASGAVATYDSDTDMTLLEVESMTRWVAESGDFGTAENWSGYLVPTRSEAFLISSGKASIASGNLTRDASIKLSGTGELAIEDGRFVNAVAGEAVVTVSDQAKLTHRGQYFLVANQHPGSILQTGGAVSSTVSRGWFLSDGGSSVGSYRLNGGSLSVFSSAGNGVHIGKNSSGDRFLVDGGTASFNATASNMRVYLSKGSEFRIDSGSATFDGFKYFIVGRDYEADSLTKVTVAGGSLTLTNFESGGGLAIANKNDGEITVSGGAFTVEGDVWLGDADGGFSPKPTASLVQTGGDVTIEGSLVLSRASGGKGTYTMTGGTLAVSSISIGSGDEPSFVFEGGEISLAGDQTRLFEESWFHAPANAKAAFDEGTGRTTLYAVDLDGIVLRHHYPLDSDASDTAGSADLASKGDGISYVSEGGAVDGFLSLGGSDDYLLASLDEGSSFAGLGDYSVFRPFTVSVWVRQTAEQASSSTQAVFGMTTNSANSGTYNTGFSVITRENSGGLGVRQRARNGGSGSNEGEVNTSYSVVDGNWHHIVAVYDSDQRSVYIDGIYRGRNETTIPIETNPIRYFSIGAFIRAGNILDDFPGDLDDLQFYTGAATGKQALQLFRNPGKTLNDSLPDPGSDDGYPDPATTELADIVDPWIGVNGSGSCVPGAALPHSSIYPSPDTLAAASSGYLSGSPVVGFSQLHAQGAGSSTLSYGNFLVSPRIGQAINESDSASAITNIVARPYSFSGYLTRWGIDTALAPTANSAIYEFEFPASDDARLNFDIARKLGSATAMSSGSIEIDLEAGTISGGGTFDGNWNPAAYKLYFYAKVDATPVSGGTWVGGTANDGTLEASMTSRQKLGGWLRFDTRTEQTVRMKIAVSFNSVERAKQYLESENAGWDLGAVELAAKTRWNETLGVIATPGISGAEARKLYTALYHSLIQPRDRTGDPEGWTSEAPFWDDQYTIWDTWITLYPLMAIVDPESVASNVNSFAERFARNGVAETAFIMGKDYQVGQGGDEVERVIADAFAKDIPGIDWEAVWDLMEFNAARRTPDYRNLGFVSTDGDANGYDFRLQSASSTLGFAHGDWAASRVAASLGHTEAAEALLERSGNWRKVWNPNATDAGFSGFIQGRRRGGSFLSDAPTSSAGFYQGTSWNYSFNVPHERDALIELMGGRARFTQRLEYALRQNSGAYIDFTNEPGFQTTFLFGHVNRPYLTSYWADLLRLRFGESSFPGDEDSGAMSSLYFFITAGLFPMATDDVYYLHGPRVPEISYSVGAGKTFTVTAEGVSEDNIFVQSATLNSVVLEQPFIRHSDIVAGSDLHLVMGPYPSTWGTGGDFAAPVEFDSSAAVDGTWATALGSVSIGDAETASPVWGEGSNSADNSALFSSFEAIELGAPGASITLAATVRLKGLGDSDGTGVDRFAWGLFHQEGEAVTWNGYLATNDANNDGVGTLLRKSAASADTFYASGDGESLAFFNVPTPSFDSGEYRLTLTLTRTESYGLDYYAGLVRVSDNVLFAAYTGSDLAPEGFVFNTVGFRAGDALNADSIEIVDCTVYSVAGDLSDSSLVLQSQVDDAGYVALTWSGVGAGADSILVRYRLSGTTEWQILAEDVDPAKTSYTADQLAVGEEYEFQIVEIRDGVYSKYSNSGSATPTANNSGDEMFFLAKGATWRYLDNGVDQGTAWRASGFDDSSWSSGAAQLGYGDGDEATVLSYGSDGGNKYPSYYFRTKFSVSADELSKVAKLKFYVQRDDAVAVYLNGVEVLRDNLPEDADYYTYSTGVVDNGAESEFFEYIVDVAALVAGDNVLAAEVHQQRPSSSDVSFDLALEGIVKGDRSVIESGETWSYSDSGTDLGTVWRDAGYNDASWSAGVAQLGYGDGDEVTVVSYGGNSSNKHPTTYFRKRFEVSDPSIYATALLEVLRDDGAVVYINGREVARDNMPSGEVGYGTYASTAIGGSDESTFYAFYLPMGYFVSGENVVAVEIHNGNATSSDLSFDLKLTLKGDVDPNAPTFESSSIAAPHGTAASDYSFDLSGYVGNLDGDTLRYAIVSGPSWLRIDATGKLVGVPAIGDLGDYEVVVSVSDDDGAATVALVFTIDEEPELARAPQPGSADALTFGIIPDTQGPDNGVPIDEVKALASQFLERLPDFVVHVGDVTDGNREGDGKLSELEDFNSYLTDPLAEQGIEFYPVRGNHDTKAHTLTSSGVPAWKVAFESLFTGEDPRITIDPTDVPGGSESSPNRSNFSFVLKASDDVYMVGLDIWEGYANENYSSWVGEKFAEIRAESPGAHIFAFSHSGMFASGSHPAMSEYIGSPDPFIALAKEYKIDGWVSGHNHIFDRSMAVDGDAMPMFFNLTSGSASTKFYGLSRSPVDGQHINRIIDSTTTEGHPIAYQLVSVNGDFVTISTYMSPDSDGKGTFDDWSVWDEYTYSLNGDQFSVASGENYNLYDIVSDVSEADGYAGTSARILDGVNSDETIYSYGSTSFGRYRNVSLGWWKGSDWYDEGDRQIVSDVLSVFGMRDTGDRNRTDLYTLALSFDPSRFTDEQISSFSIVAFLDDDTSDGDAGDWFDAVQKVIGEASETALLRAPRASDPNGSWGIDLAKGEVWARIDFQGDFAISMAIEDEDRDGLSDDWEIENFGNLGQAESDDPDRDGADNAAEQLAGTNPNLADTDGDHFNDGVEIEAGLDPLVGNTELAESLFEAIQGSPELQNLLGLYHLGALGHRELVAVDENGDLVLELQLWTSEDLENWDEFGSPVERVYRGQGGPTFFKWTVKDEVVDED